MKKPCKFILKTFVAYSFIVGVGLGLGGNSMADDKTTNVTSYNQSGGITAGTVNIGAQLRSLNDRTKEQISSLAKQHSDGKEIDVTAVMGDGEAFQFSEKIKSYLEELGYTVRGVNQAVFNKPVQGQNIEPAKNDKIMRFIIASKMD